MTITEFIQENIDCSFTESDLPFNTHWKTLPKGTIICDYGQVEKKMYFLQSGIAHVNIGNSNHDIRIVDFFFHNNFFCSYTSLLSNSPSDVQIVAATNCEVEIVFASELFKSYEHSLVANQLGRRETEKLYLRKVKREKEFLTQTAEERYFNLVNTNSELLNQLSLDSIAKYLGIHPESLSRIRRKSIQQIKKSN